MEQGIIWVLSVSAVQWSPVKPVEWDAIQPQELIRNPKPLFVNTTVWLEISYEVLSFTEIKGKKKTQPYMDNSLGFYIFILNEKFMNL